MKPVTIKEMLKEHLNKRRLILASGSHRRQDLLKQLGVPFEICVKPVDEVYPQKLSGHEISDYLSILKANAFKENLKTNDLLITSDTIVWHRNTAIGKPNSLKHAIEMLQNLSNSTHKVITSVCLTSTEKQKTFNALTKVSFRKLKIEEIEFYVNNYKPLDKAGAYGIQDWIGQVGVEKIEGSYFNVMGFPLNLVYSHLLEF
ncbi:MAG: Maf family nucleotide pyrophosphatase [Flavobacteriaceae bacterium]